MGSTAASTGAINERTSRIARVRSRVGGFLQLDLELGVWLHRERNIPLRRWCRHEATDLPL